jgi:hypothetical protein
MKLGRATNVKFFGAFSVGRHAEHVKIDGSDAV